VAELEAIQKVRDFVEQGGNVLLVIAFATAVMWTLIYERFWYFRFRQQGERERLQAFWRARHERASWNAHQIRQMLISQMRHRLERGLPAIETVVKLCPMLGLLGTVTGMVEVFDVMAVSGSGNARGMASGIYKATLPTMAGMVAALSGMAFSVQLRRFARDETARVADNLETEHV
jgi:biopolymer transport protein ExbB